VADGWKSHDQDRPATSSAGHAVANINRVYSVLADEIAAGVRQPGERLPPERVLAEEFGVGRATLRRAFAALSAEGLIESHVGRGTFVAGGYLGEPPNVLMSFTELGRSHGLTPEARVLAKEVREASLDEGEAFGIVAGAQLFQLDRVRFLDGQPIATDSVRTPLALAPDLVEVDFSTQSLYEALAKHGCGPVRADYTVEARIATEPEATLLAAPAGSAVLVAVTRGYDDRGRLVELGHTVYRGDRYRFDATLRRRRQPWHGPAITAPDGNRRTEKDAAPTRRGADGNARA
jgi:GntR family transcriptional regulator